MQNARLDDSQDGIKTAKRNTNNLRYADDTTLMAESKEELKMWRTSWWGWKRRIKKKKKAGLKFNIQKTKFMATDPTHFVASKWGNKGNSDRFYLLVLQK